MGSRWVRWVGEWEVHRQNKTVFMGNLRTTGKCAGFIINNRPYNNSPITIYQTNAYIVAQ